MRFLVINKAMSILKLIYVIVPGKHKPCFSENEMALALVVSTFLKKQHQGPLSNLFINN